LIRATFESVSDLGAEFDERADLGGRMPARRMESEERKALAVPVREQVDQGGEFDWSFGAERSPGVNNRSIVQAMGKALGGGASINGMVWARGQP
jgi:choline dehydrogenase-like flavoprotein